MVPAGTSRETDFGREVPAFEVDAMAVEPVFHRLYSYIFDMESGRYSGEEMDRPVPSAIFIVNFDKVRVDPRKKDIDLESLMYGRISQLTEEEMKKQEGDYVYRYRYNGGGASQVCLSSGRARGHQINAFIFKFKARGMKMKFRNQMNVLEVNKTDYENCISDHPLHNWTTGAGRDVVPLNVTRKYYFISGKGFCYGGMKFVNFFSSLFYLNISM